MVSHQQRQRAAHEQRGQKEKEETRRTCHQQAPPAERISRTVKDIQRQQTISTDHRLRDTECQQQRQTRLFTQPAPEDAANSQTHHEGADHDGHALHIAPKNGQQRALPNQLVKQRRDAAQKENGVQHGT